VETTLANSVSARKRARQAEKRRLRNASQRSALRTAIKKTIAAIESGDKSEAQSAYKDVVPAIDRSVSKGLIHRNKAARHKSRMNAAIKAL
jgi:small subunit ribosomal protein S20